VKHFWFRSVTVQLAILFVAALMVFELVSLGYRYLYRSNALTALESVRIADHVAVITSLIERTPREQRPAVLRNFKGSDLYVYWRSEQPLSYMAANNPDTILLRDLLMNVVPHAANSDIIVGYDPSGSDAVTLETERLATLWKKAGPYQEPVEDIINELAGHPTYFVSVRLSDGSWLNFLAAYVDTIDFWPLRSLTILFLLVVGVVGLSIWAIQRLTAPFRVFATAATRLATDVNAPPIDEHGPSEVRRAIRVFNTMQEKLQRFIEDRTQMVAAVSHDLRTPITRLRLRAEYIKDRTQAAKFLADLKEMEDMIAGVLSFAKEDALSEPTTAVDLRALLQGICDDLTDRGFEVSFAPSGRLPYRCKRLSIRRCLNNVLENAVKYGVGVDVSFDCSDSEIRIRVDDRGPGIPEHLREQVFRPFFRLESSRSRDSGGCGLGLTVARTIARAHGGDVLLSERPGGGLRATIVLTQDEALPTLPLAAEPPDSKSASRIHDPQVCQDGSAAEQRSN
jgi:signal transduction histidine kinase